MSCFGIGVQNRLRRIAAAGAYGKNAPQCIICVACYDTIPVCFGFKPSQYRIGIRLCLAERIRRTQNISEAVIGIAGRAAACVHAQHIADTIVGIGCFARKRAAVILLCGDQLFPAVVGIFGFGPLCGCADGLYGFPFPDDIAAAIIFVLADRSDIVFNGDRLRKKPAESIVCICCRRSCIVCRLDQLSKGVVSACGKLPGRIVRLYNLPVFIILVFCGKGKIPCSVSSRQFQRFVPDIIIRKSVQMFCAVQKLAGLDDISAFIRVLCCDNGWGRRIADDCFGDLLVQTALSRVVVSIARLRQDDRVLHDCL